MASNEVFLDTNVLLELFLLRHKHQAVLQAIATFPAQTLFYASILSISTFFYYVEKMKLSKQAAHNFLARYKFLDINQADYEWARANDAGDFENALQTACARRHGCRQLLTLDQDFAAMYGKYLQVVAIT